MNVHTRPLMKCGCVAQGTCSQSGGKKFDPPVPSCVVHSCIEIAENAPDLSGRLARCAYRPHGHADRPSSFDLPFFVFRGDASPEATDKCKCGMAWIAHQPRWRAAIKVARRWYKIERDESVTNREFHCPPALAKQKAEAEADFFRQQTRSEDTKVFSAEVVKLEEIKNPIKCAGFTAHGPHEFDEFYCGCHGWD